MNATVVLLLRAFAQHIVLVQCESLRPHVKNTFIDADTSMKNMTFGLLLSHVLSYSKKLS